MTTVSTQRSPGKHELRELPHVEVANTNRVALPLSEKLKPPFSIADVGRSVYAEALLDPFGSRPIQEAPFEIVRRLWGFDAIRTCPLAGMLEMGAADSVGLEVKGRPAFYYRWDLDRAGGNFAIAKVLARMFIEQRGIHAKTWDDDVAAWISAPPLTVEMLESRRRRAGVRFDIRGHAETLGVAPEAVIRSIVGTMAASTVLVEGRRVRRFGAKTWLSDAQLIAVARGKNTRTEHLLRRRLSQEVTALILAKDGQ